MLESIAASSYGFWGAALLIVALDGIVLLAPGEFAFRFGRDGAPRLRIAVAPFLLRGKELFFPPLTAFAQFYFVSAVGAAPVGAEKLDALRGWARQHRSIHVYSVIAAVLLFVVGPALSFSVGIARALLTVLPILYVNALAALIDLAASRKALNLPARRLWFVAFEFLICPALVVNLNKRLVDRTVVPSTLELIGDDAALEARLRANLACHDLAEPLMGPNQNG
jgi:hypothetical protein